MKNKFRIVLITSILTINLIANQNTEYNFQGNFEIPKNYKFVSKDNITMSSIYTFYNLKNSKNPKNNYLAKQIAPEIGKCLVENKNIEGKILKNDLDDFENKFKWKTDEFENKFYENIPKNLLNILSLKNEKDQTKHMEFIKNYTIFTFKEDQYFTNILFSKFVQQSFNSKDYLYRIKLVIFNNEFLKNMIDKYKDKGYECFVETLNKINKKKIRTNKDFTGYEEFQIKPEKEKKYKTYYKYNEIKDIHNHPGFIYPSEFNPLKELESN